MTASGRTSRDEIFRRRGDRPHVMRRRDFLTAGAAAAVTLASAGSKAAVFQSGDGPLEIWMMPRIAFVASDGRGADMRMQGDARWRALLQELVRLGFVEGETITIDRWPGRGRGIASRRVVDSGPDVIVSRDSRATRSLLRRTTTIPIINMGSFPENWDFVASFEHPGGNVTGITLAPPGDIFTRQVQLLHGAVPTTLRVAWLGPRGYWTHRYTAATRKAAEQLGLALVPMLIDYPIEKPTIQQAFREVAGDEIGALFVSSAVDMHRHRETVVELAAAARLPAVSLQREYTELGILMSYYTNQAERYRVAAGYVDRILRGTLPADMPVQQPTAFDLIINLQTARTLGIAIPPALMIQATEFIE